MNRPRGDSGPAAAVASYAAGPDFLLGPSPTPVVARRGTLCAAFVAGADPVLLVFPRRSLVPGAQQLEDVVVHHGRPVVPGRTALLACVGEQYADQLDDLRLPPGFSADGPMCIVM